MKQHAKKNSTQRNFYDRAWNRINDESTQKASILLHQSHKVNKRWEELIIKMNELLWFCYVMNRYVLYFLLKLQFGFLYFRQYFSHFILKLI